MLAQRLPHFGLTVAGCLSPKVWLEALNVDLLVQHRSKVGVFLKRKIVVICPVKDESWILEKFLTAASLFADHIVVLDHNSSDNSKEIASKFAKVELIDYPGSGFDENSRRRILLERARSFGQGNLIFALDADEFFSPEFLSSEIQKVLHSAPEGTRFRVPLANLRPGLKDFWVEKMDPVGLVDDGSTFDHGKEIHFPRLPSGKQANVVELPNVFLMHLQYVDWNRMLSKRRWYMAWENINYPTKHPLRIIRRYSHMDVIHPSQTSQMPVSWVTDYLNYGLDLRELAKSPNSYRWDAVVREWVLEGRVRDWHLLLSAEDLEKLGLQTNLRQGRQISRQNRYLGFTSAIYAQRRFLFWRIALRLLDELASRVCLR
jgi:glycosyltransferase involved in cell wall biosynthesis